MMSWSPRQMQQYRRLILGGLAGLFVLAFLLVSTPRTAYHDPISSSNSQWNSNIRREESFEPSTSCGWDIDAAVRTVLEDFSKDGISKQQVEHYLINSTARSHTCVLIQVLTKPTGQNYVTYGFPWRSFPFVQGSIGYHRMYNLLDVVLTVVDRANKQKQPLPPLEFTACFGDCVVSMNPHDPYTQAGYRHFTPVYPWIEGPLPVFTSVTCPGSSNIPFIFWDGNSTLDDWENEIDTILTNKQQYPWESRIPKAVFRGGGRTCTIDADEEGRGSITHYSTSDPEIRKRCGRHALYHHANRLTPHKEWFDVNLGGPHLPMAAQENYKYIIYAGGHCQWANRLRIQLFMENAILRQASQCNEWYGLFLKPWQHYIPVDYHFDNLTEAVQWAQDHEDEVRAMNERKLAYAHCALHKDNQLDYAERLLRSYARLLRYEVTRRESAKEWSRRSARMVQLPSPNRS